MNYSLKFIRFCLSNALKKDKKMSGDENQVYFIYFFKLQEVVYQISNSFTSTIHQYTLFPLKYGLKTEGGLSTLDFCAYGLGNVQTARERRERPRRKSFLQKNTKKKFGKRQAKTNKLPPHPPTENEYIKCVLTLTLNSKKHTLTHTLKMCRQNKLKERRGRTEQEFIH